MMDALGLSIDVTLNDTKAKEQLGKLLETNTIQLNITSSDLSGLTQQMETLSNLKLDEMITSETLDALKAAEKSLENQAKHAKFIADTYDKRKPAISSSRRSNKIADDNFKRAVDAEKELIRLEQEASRLSGKARENTEKELQKAREHADVTRELVKGEQTLKRLDAERQQLRIEALKFTQQQTQEENKKKKPVQDGVSLLKIQKEAYQDIKRINSQIASLQQANVGKKLSANSSETRRVYIAKLQEEKKAIIETLKQYDLLDARKEKEVAMVEKYNNTKLIAAELAFTEKLAAADRKRAMQKQEAWKREKANMELTLKNAEAEMAIRERSLYTGRNKDYVSDALRTAYEEKKAALSAATSQKQLQQAIKETRYAYRMMAADANAMRQSAPKAVDSLATSFKNLTRYVSGAMIIRQVFASFRQGIQDVKQLDSAITTLRMTMQELSENEIEELMKSSQEMARQFKASVSTVLTSVQTVANAQESVQTILDKTKPAVILSNLTGMGSDQTVDMIQGSLRQFDALKDGSAEAAMSVADAMVSISKSLGMDFATGIQGMSDSISILGSVANQLGLTMEETLSQISAVSETTRLTFSETATSLKTIMSRVMRVADGETTSDEMLKTQKALESIGVTVRDKTTGAMREFDAIMADLANRYDSLTAKQQDYVADALGGARQVSSVIALVQSQTRAQELLTEALNGSGSAMEAQETWSQSLEAKMQDLTSAFAIFWQTFLNSEAVGTFLTSTTAMIDGLTRMTETFGALPTVITLSGNAVMLFNKNIRQLGLIGVQTVIPALGRMTSGLNEQRIALEEQKFALEQAIAAQKAKIASTEKLIAQGKTYDKHGKNLNRSLRSRKQILDHNTKALEVNGAALKNNTLKTIGLNVAMNVGLMAAFTAVTLIIGKVAESFKSLEEKMEDSRQAAEDLQSTLKEVEQAELDLSEYKHLNKLLESSNLTLEKREETLARIQEIEENSGSGLEGYSAILQSDNLLLEDKLRLLEAIQQKELNEAAKTLDDSILSNTAMNTQLMELDSHISRRQQMIDAMQNVSDDGFVRLMDGTKLSLAEAQLQLQYFEDQIRNTYIAVGERNAQLETLERANYTTKKSTIEMSDTQKEVAESIVGATDKVDDNTDALKDNANAAEDAANNQSLLEEQLKENKNSFIDSTKTLSELTELLKDVETNGITLDNIDNDLLEDFTGNITNAAEVQDYLRQKIEETKESQLLAYEQMMANDAAFYQTQVKNSEAYNTYKQNLENAMLKLITELRNKGLHVEANALNEQLAMAKEALDDSKTLAEARAKIEESLINGMRQGWSEYYKMNITQMEENLKWYYANKDQLDPYKAQQWGQLAAEMEAYLDSYNSVIDIAGKPITIDPPTFSSVSSSGSSSGSSSANKVDDLDLEIDRYHDLERAITRVNNALKKNEIAQESSASPTKKIQLMKEEIELYQQLREAQKALYAEQKKEASELKKQLSKKGFKFNEDGSIKNYASQLSKLEKEANKLSGEAKKAKIEEVKALKELADAYEKLVNETMPDTQAEYQELANTIKELEKEQLEYVADIQEKITDALTEELEKRTDAIKKELQKQRDLYNEEYEQEQWEDDFKKEQDRLNEIMQSINNLSRDNSEAGKLKLEQLYKELAEQQQVLDEMLNDKAHEDGNQAFDDAEQALDEALEESLSAENLAQMVNQALTQGFIQLDGEIIKTETLLSNMLENSGEAFLATGQLLREELIDGLTIAQGLMAELSASSRTLSIPSLSSESVQAYQTIPNTSRAIQASGAGSTAQTISVAFDQLLNVEGNLDTTLMLDLETKLRQAMDQVTLNISKALSYR